MKRQILLGTAMLVALPLLAAESAKDEITAAAKKLAAKSNYSWKSTLDFGANSQFPAPGPAEGKTEKDGLTSLTSPGFQDNVNEGIMKGTNNVVVKTADGWQKAEEVIGAGGGGGGGGGGGQFNFSANFARQMQNLKTPAVDIEELAAKAQGLKKDGDAYSGELSEDSAKALLTFRGRRGAPPTNAKGSVKIWLKDGEIVKYQTKATGKRQNQAGEETDVERTTTIEIKDVGTTKITVPEEAKKKLS